MVTMRTGPRTLIACFVLFAALCSRASAADTLDVLADSNSIALGTPTTLTVRVQTDAGFQGGHVALKFRGADSDCAASPEADPGDDATDAPLSIGAGAATTDLGGNQIQLDVGNWVVCGWLVDDATGAVVAHGFTVVQVVPFEGALSVAVKRVKRTYRFTLAYSTSEVAQLYAALEPAGRPCERRPSAIRKRALLLLPRGGRLITSDGRLGRTISARRLKPGRWRVCAWLHGDDGGVGPVTKRFAVPRARRRGGRAAG